MNTDTLQPDGSALARESANVHEQFTTADQQREVATLGMWVFLSTEILFFGAMFVGYAVYRLRWPEDFRHGSSDLKWYLGAINTAVLLLSSYVMALAVHAAQRGENREIVRRLVLTIALAMVFLGIKGTEYFLEYDEGLLPGAAFRFDAPNGGAESSLTHAVARFEEWIQPVAPNPFLHSRRAEHEPLFMCFYFTMTAIHATHMLVGIGLMCWLILLARRKRFSVRWHNPVTIIGLYWHFVDTVWVFLFPILYLLRNP